MEYPHAATVEEQVARAESEGWDYRGDMATEGEVLDLIYALVRCEKPEICVETGTYHGHGTQAIANALEKNGRGHLWTVENDPVFEYEPRKQVTFETEDSVVWATKVGEHGPVPIDFAFVDCGEPKHRVKVAGILWKKIRPGGMMVVHDTQFYETQFINGLSKAVGQTPSLHVPTLNGVSVWRKK